MNEGFDKLKSIGVQKIHEATHISRVHIEVILNGGFDDMNKIQLLGFISILEREYSLDLEGLRSKSIEYFSENQKDINPEDSKVFVAPKRRRNLVPVYIITAIVIFISFIFMTMDFSNDKKTEVIHVDNSVIENAKNNIAIKIEDVNTTSTNEIEFKKEQVKAKEQAKIINTISSFKIKPKVKVWLGYIELKTHKKYQRTFSNEFSLDPKKDWLLAFGHGHVNIEINGVVKKYKIKQNVRFSYIDGELKEIGLEKFRALNKGDRW